MKNTEWLLCPTCGGKTRDRIREDTILINYPLYCPKCKQEHLAEDLSLSVLAEEFHLNPQYISQLFKNEIGVNFLSYLTNIRMEKAKKLLISTSLSIAEVADQSGYGDYRVFTKVFKKSEGITPSQYRRDNNRTYRCFVYPFRQEQRSCRRNAGISD